MSVCARLRICGGRGGCRRTSAPGCLSSSSSFFFFILFYSLCSAPQAPGRTPQTAKASDRADLGGACWCARGVPAPAAQSVLRVSEFDTDPGRALAEEAHRTPLGCPPLRCRHRSFARRRGGRAWEAPPADPPWPRAQEEGSRRGARDQGTEGGPLSLSLSLASLGVPGPDVRRSSSTADEGGREAPVRRENERTSREKSCQAGRPIPSRTLLSFFPRCAARAPVPVSRPPHPRRPLR